MRERFIPFLSFVSRPHVALGSAVILGTAIVGYMWYATAIAPSGQFMRVASGSITEEVDVTGAVQAAHRTDLAFQTSGRVAAVRVAVGDHVQAWQILVALDRSSQAAAIALAKANLEVQQSKLSALVAGTRPEQLAIDQTAVTQAENALASALTAAYTSADDAVHAKADQMFSNPRNQAAQLTILVPDAKLTNQVQTERVALNPVLAVWQHTPSAASDSESLTASSQKNMKIVAAFLDDLTAALAEAQPDGATSAATLVGYQTSVNTGRVNVSTALSALIAADTAYKAAAGALVLARAGATANDIAAQQAAVDAAQASVDAAEAAAAQAVIVAPVAGTITMQNADLGETVVPGTPLVSMIADGKYQASAQVSETDIAKVKTGDAVTATFAAYPGAVFPATVTTVDPAATIIGGVASYGVTVTFTDNDTRLLPGLSANLRVVTTTRNAALLVPASAILTDGVRKFVYVRTAKGIVKTPITVGIESTDGIAEIVSGLAAGDTVLTFGLSGQGASAAH